MPSDSEIHGGIEAIAFLDVDSVDVGVQLGNDRRHARQYAALIPDLDGFERNLARLNESLAGRSVKVRPHAKSHKCPQIALRQMALGAVGVCCQKVSEAEAMVAGGVPDVLIANEVVGAIKLKRLAAMARQARVAVCADHPGNVAALDAAARDFGVRLDVLVEIDVGANRCGVEPGPAAKLAQQIAACANLRFAGLQGLAGAAAPAVRSAGRGGAGRAGRPTAAVGSKATRLIWVQVRRHGRGYRGRITLAAERRTR